MRTWSLRRLVLTALAACTVLLPPVSASAHIGGRLLMVHGLSDDDLSRLDLGDGSTDDWQQVVGDPSVWADALDNPWQRSYDPADLDFRIWLAWHPASGRLYVAYEAADDRHLALVQLDDGSVAPLDDFELMVDGDHSGGRYSLFFEEPEEEQKRDEQRTAQFYQFSASSIDGQYILSPSAATWHIAPPYAEAHGALAGEDPAISVIEGFVTSFDELIWDSPAQSAVSQLWPGKTIGVDLGVTDHDIVPTLEPGSPYDGAFYYWSGTKSSWRDAGLFVDAVLLAPGASTSVVADLSWARIKAGFQQGR